MVLIKQNAETLSRACVCMPEAQQELCEVRNYTSCASELYEVRNYAKHNTRAAAES